MTAIQQCSSADFEQILVLLEPFGPEKTGRRYFFYKSSCTARYAWSMA